MTSPMVLRALQADLERIVDILHTSDHRILAQRLHDWTAGLPAQRLDPDRTSPPNIVDADGVPVPQFSDPTGNAAIGRTETDFRTRFMREAVQARVLRQVLTEVARSSVASTEEQMSADADTRQVMSSNCEVCDEPVTRGADVAPDDKRYLHHIEGVDLCSTHKRMRYKGKYKVMPIEQFVPAARKAVLDRTPLADPEKQASSNAVLDALTQAAAKLGGTDITKEGAA